MKPCGHDDRRAGCPHCTLYATREDYRAACDGAARPPANLAARRSFALPVCPLRGGPTGETRPCPTCTGTVAVPLLACSVHGVCTDAKLIAGVQCCRICPDRKSRPARPE